MKHHNKRSLTRQIANGVARYLSNAPLRRSIHAATAQRLWRLPSTGVSDACTRQLATLQTLVAPTRGRVDILATRHVSYLAHVIQASLSTTGLDSRIYYDDEIFHDFGQRFVVLCPHVFTAMPKRYVAFQLEQTVSSRWFTPQCIARLKNAEAVWEYCHQNIQFLVDEGVPRARIVHMPITTMAGYDAWLHATYPHFVTPVKKTIDVLFYGDPHSPRRQAFLAELRKHFSVRIVDKVFGVELQQLVSSAKLVVNIHYYESALLETTRLSEAMSLGVPVVSETAADQADHQLLSDAVCFTSMGDIAAMVTAVDRLLHSATDYAAQLAAVEQLRSSDSRFEQAIVGFFG